MGGLAGVFMQGSSSWAHDLAGRTWFMLIVGGACAGWFLVRQYIQTRRLRLLMPPGPHGWPILGSLFQILTSKLPMHETLAKLAEVYGPVMFLRLGSLPCVVITSAEVAEEVLKDSNFSHRATETLLFSVRHLEFENQGFLSHYDDQLKQIRKSCTVEMLNTKGIATFAKARTVDVQSTIVNVARIRQGKQLVNVEKAIGNQGLNIMTQMLLGKRFYGINAEAAKALQNFSAILPDLLQLAGTMYWGDLLPPIRWLDLSGHVRQYKKLRLQMEAAFRAIIEDFRIKGVKVDKDDGRECTSFTEVLLSQQQENNLSDKAIMAVIQDLITGGSGAFAITTQWALAELVRNPKKLRRLQEEIDNVVGGARPVEESDIANLPYLRACVRESLRLYPTLPLLLPRETEEAITLEGYYIPPKTVVLVNAWQIGRNPQHYENAEDFEPERFLGSDRIEVADRHFLAFGGGRRVCVGMKLGTIMIQMTLASLVQAYNWAPPPGMDSKDIDVASTLGMFLAPKIPIYLQATPRLQPDVYDINSGGVDQAT